MSNQCFAAFCLDAKATFRPFFAHLLSGRWLDWANNNYANPLRRHWSEQWFGLWSFSFGYFVLFVNVGYACKIIIMNLTMKTSWVLISVLVSCLLMHIDNKTKCWVYESARCSFWVYVCCLLMWRKNFPYIIYSIGFIRSVSRVL